VPWLIILKELEMDQGEIITQQLEGLNAKLFEINHNMLKVFWIVAVFALLYFGLMIYLLFIR
jgi:phage shock protein PspC (stress-responsive transcriptional regulator)